MCSPEHWLSCNYELLASVLNGLCPPSVPGQGGIGEFCFLLVQRCNYYITTGLFTIYGGKELGRLTSFTHKQVYYQSVTLKTRVRTVHPSVAERPSATAAAATCSDYVPTGSSKAQRWSLRRLLRSHQESVLGCALTPDSEECRPH